MGHSADCTSDCTHADPAAVSTAGADVQAEGTLVSGATMMPTPGATTDAAVATATVASTGNAMTAAGHALDHAVADEDAVLDAIHLAKTTNVASLNLQLYFGDAVWVTVSVSRTISA